MDTITLEVVRLPGVPATCPMLCTHCEERRATVLVLDCPVGGVPLCPECLEAMLRCVGA